MNNIIINSVIICNNANIKIVLEFIKIYLIKKNLKFKIIDNSLIYNYDNQHINVITDEILFNNKIYTQCDFIMIRSSTKIIPKSLLNNKIYIFDDLIQEIIHTDYYEIENILKSIPLHLISKEMYKYDILQYKNYINYLNYYLNLINKEDVNFGKINNVLTTFDKFKFIFFTDNEVSIFISMFKNIIRKVDIYRRDKSLIDIYSNITIKKFIKMCDDNNYQIDTFNILNQILYNKIDIKLKFSLYSYLLNILKIN